MTQPFLNYSSNVLTQVASLVGGYIHEENSKLVNMSARIVFLYIRETVLLSETQNFKINNIVL